MKGFVTVNPRWSGFKEGEYFQAACSVYQKDEVFSQREAEVEIEVDAGDLDLRGFEITRSEFFDSFHHPYLKFNQKHIQFNTTIVRKYGEKNYVEFLINPVKRKLAIRPSIKENRNAIQISKPRQGVYFPRPIQTAAFRDTIFALFDWNTEYNYRVSGHLYEQDGESVYIFDAADSEAYIKPQELLEGEDDSVQALTSTGKSIRAIPEEWITTFGKQFYIHEKSLVEIENQKEEDWMLRLQGQLYETGNKLKVTSFEELKEFIDQELQGITIEEGEDE